MRGNLMPQAAFARKSTVDAAPRGSIFISGLYRVGDEAAPPNERAYFGEDVAQRRERSPAEALVQQRTPIMLAFAELNPERFNAQSEALAKALREAGREPVVVKLPGHSHISEILSIGTEDTSLSAPLLEFLRR